MSFSKWPSDWVIPAKPLLANDGMIMAVIFGNKKGFRLVRSLVFQRCVVSGKYIWPFQKVWIGMIIISYARTAMEDPGSYAVACISEEQYVIQKLKGNV